MTPGEVLVAETCGDCRGVGGGRVKHQKLKQAALSTWGLRAQKIMLMEECGELIQAVAKSMRVSRLNSHSVSTADVLKIGEEIADTLFCIDQMFLAYPELAPIVERIDNEKSERLKDRLAHAGVVV